MSCQTLFFCNKTAWLDGCFLLGMKKRAVGQLGEVLRFERVIEQWWHYWISGPRGMSISRFHLTLCVTGCLARQTRFWWRLSDVMGNVVSSISWENDCKDEVGLMNDEQTFNKNSFTCSKKRPYTARYSPLLHV